MAGTNLGKAWVEIVPSAQNLPSQMKAMFEGPSDEAGKSAGNKLIGSLKKVIATAGIGAALKKTLDYGAELQQNLGGTEAVFGKHAEKLQNTARSAYKNMGLSASDYMATANKMGSLFQGSGVSQVKSLKMTEEAMQRAADVASVMGIDTSMAMESIAGAAKGNFTMMDNLGVAMNATTLQAYALEKGVNFKWDTASNAEKAELAMQMFMERTAQYQGNFAKESESTLSGSIGAMKAAAQDFMGNLTLGENIGPAMNNLVETAVAAAGNLIPAIGNVLSGLPGAITTAMDAIHPALMEGLNTAIESVKTNFPTMLQGALKGLLDFSSAIRENAGQLVESGLTLIKSLADGIIQNIPTIIQTVPTIISNFAGIINDNAPKVIQTGISIIKSLAVGLIKAIPVLIANIPQILTAIWDVFTAFQWLNLGKQLVSKIGSGIKGGAKAVWNAVKGLMTNTKNTVVKGFTSLKGTVTSIWNGIKTAITHPIQTAVTLVKNAISKIKAVLKGKISLPHIKLPHFSISGKFSLNPPSIPKIGVSWYKKAEDTPYLFKDATLFGAGERKDEVLYGRSSLMRDIKEATSGGNTFNVTLNANGAENPEQYAQRFARELRRQVRMGTI